MAEPSDDDDRAAYYRESAETIRRLARQIRFDCLRRRQLMAFAGAFDRLAEQIALRGREVAD